MSVPVIDDFDEESSWHDPILLTWFGVWALIVSLACAAAGSNARGGDPSDDEWLVIGLAMGACTATWTAIGNWALLMELPSHGPAKKSAQRLRIGIAVVTVLTFFAIGSACTKSMDSFATTALATVVSWTMPFVIWQWFRRPLHRGQTVSTGRRQIREILGIAVTIALVNALLKLASLSVHLSPSRITMILSVAAIWTLMMWTMLSCRWYWMLLVVPLFVGQPFLVLLAMQLEDSTYSTVSSFVVGFYCSHFLMAMLFLSLMRSSGHHWFRTTEAATG
ncbi:hypothetical protein [Rhodopirellula halodulae]|uniref:hypothetical protein n=1 Tax=Rhodopirellula halodulae TaxID=2894198 RepID=UPI001E467264|nr:hypothetical protein [Rhodopirellula sp. JC737]MCC9655121.1 hypothetical protein [Rhodopirellula sp. JC737]